MAITKHVKHIRSSVADSIPTTEQLDYGEIAINYSAENERLFIKNANNEIVPFYSGKVIEENEQVTAAALADLDGRINDIEENNVNTENMESVTYSELKSKRDGGELVPGKHYRITDYVTTTSQENTQSAGHQFDVVVLALDEKTLSENAHAMLHEGDTYFANSNLEAWKIWYCLDNDQSRFAWADSVNGKGVIYYMKDEWNNECPYDFKNIQFKRYQLKNQNYLYASKALWDNDGDTYGNEAITNFHNIFAILYNNLGTSINDNTIPFYYTRGKHDEYYIVDESKIYGYNEIYKTYRDNSGNTIALSESGTRKFVALYNLLHDYYDIILEVNDTDGEWMYTFSRKNDINIPPIDNSLNGRIFNNKFTNFTNSRILFDNVFISYNSNLFVQNNTFGNYFQNNTFGNGCGLNTFGHNCSSNIFGNECYKNSFGNFCSSNIFGNECYNNSFGNDFQYNTFGNYSHDNSFGNGCASNSFRNECALNSFGNYCASNSFGDSCRNNTFGNYFQYNTFGNYCYNNTFVDICRSNTFGDECHDNTFGNYFQYNSFGNGCESNTFGNECFNNSFGNYSHDNTFGNRCRSNTFGDYCYNNTFVDICRSNTFGDECHDNTFGNYFQYNSFGNYCYNNTFGNGCGSNTFGNAVNHVTFSKDNTYYVIVENGNQYITLTSTETTDPSNRLRNITIAQGTNNANSESGRKTITHTTINDTFRTTYQPADSVVVSV